MLSHLPSPNLHSHSFPPLPSDHTISQGWFSFLSAGSTPFLIPEAVLALPPQRQGTILSRCAMRCVCACMPTAGIGCQLAY